MDSDCEDLARRRFLSTSTAVLGGVGCALASVPFVSSWFPSDKTQALGGPVEIDVSAIAPDQHLTVAWRGKPVFVVHRSLESLKSLEPSQAWLRDPDSLEASQPNYIKTPYRAIKENFLVVTGLCTHLGCVPLYKPQKGSLEKNWLGGFFCPCHGSKYDLSGRVYKGMPAPTNLPIPPHHYKNEAILVIGEEKSI